MGARYSKALTDPDHIVKAATLKTIILLILFGMVPSLYAQNKELPPKVTVDKVIKLDREKVLGSTNRNYQIKMSDEDWNLPGLIQVNVEFVPQSPNEEGQWIGFDMYPHEDLSIKVGDKTLPCIGVIRNKMQRHKDEYIWIWGTAGIEKYTAIFTYSRDPDNGKKFKAADKLSFLFMIPENGEAFELYFKGKQIARGQAIK